MTDEPLHAFVIKGGSHGYTATITLDGKELRGVTRATLDIEAGEVTRLSLEIIPGTIEATGSGSLELRGRG